MRIVEPSAVIESKVDGAAILKRIEKAGRVCYKSEEKITPESAAEFVRKIMKRGHLSVIEHESITARFVCDRGVSHEIVRHRLVSYSQESTRYCNYASGRHGEGIAFIMPPFLKPITVDLWKASVFEAEQTYDRMIAAGESPQIARSVLPNSLKTEIVMTCNLREWRHFFTLRTSAAAHPQMREVAISLFKQMRAAIPVIFDDINPEVKS